MTQTSSIHIDSCRSDGRCPECGADPVSAYAKQPMACGCLSSGAHCWETACAARHLNALLTEALRQRDEHYFKGIKDVRMIRCMAHHKVPAFNSMEANGGECAVCVVDDIGKARDATIREVEQWKGKAIRVSGEADALERERDEAQAKLVEEREAMASISGELVQAQVKVAKERDSYRAALEECGELRSEARERAERAEALLRDARPKLSSYRMALLLQPYTGPLCADIEALLAKIREVLG